MKFNFLKLKAQSKFVLTLAALSVLSYSCGDNTKQNDSENSDAEQQEVNPDDLSDSDLRKFLEIDNEIRPLQRMADSEMIGIIERNGLTVESYSEIAQASQNPLEEPDIETSKMELFERINDSLDVVQERMMGMYEEVITKHGMNLENYIAMVNKINSSQELQQKLTEMMSMDEQNMIPEDFMMPSED